METKKYGLLLVMMEPPEEMEEEFNEWYDIEHVPEREAIPGILSARRFVAHEGYPRYLALYDLERIEVLQSEAYKRIGIDNLSPWSRRIIRHAQGFRRNVYQQIFPGQAQISKKANALMLWAYDIHEIKEKEFNQWHDTECMPHLQKIDGFIDARRFICVEGSPKILMLYEFKDIEFPKNEAYKKAFSNLGPIKKHFKETVNNIYKSYVKS